MPEKLLQGINLQTMRSFPATQLGSCPMISVVRSSGERPALYDVVLLLFLFFSKLLSFTSLRKLNCGCGVSRH